jgi:hypothetical protein
LQGVAVVELEVVEVAVRVDIEHLLAHLGVEHLPSLL